MYLSGKAVVTLHHPLVRATIKPDGDLARACRYAVDPQDTSSNTFLAQRAVAASAGPVGVVIAITGHELTETEFACSIAHLADSRRARQLISRRNSHHDEYGHDDRMLWSLVFHLNMSYNP